MPRRIRRIDGVEGVDLASFTIDEHAEAMASAARRGIMVLAITKQRNYNMIAYPGPKVVEAGRAEHLPLHFHVIYPGNRKEIELRIRTEDFEEYDGLLVPRSLKKIFQMPVARDYLVRNTRSVFETGKRLDEYKLRIF